MFLEGSQIKEQVILSMTTSVNLGELYGSNECKSLNEVNVDVDMEVPLEELAEILSSDLQYEDAKFLIISLIENIPELKKEFYVLAYNNN